MVCPYCSHKNTATATLCNQCGILLHLGRTSRAIPHGSGSGHGGPGHGMDFVRAILPGHRVKAHHTALHSQTEALVKEIQERAEGDLKDPLRAPAARLALGALFLLHGEVEKSVHWFQQARQMGGADAEFLNNAAVALARRGTLTQAAELFEQAARRSPDAVAPRANLAHLFAEAGADPDPEGAAHAAELTRQALALEPENPTLHNRLALIFCRERRYDEAIPEFVRALKLAGADNAAKADAENDTGLALALCGDPATAEKAFEAALKLDPHHAHALSNGCLARMGDGGIEGAELDKLGKAARLDPKSGTAPREPRLRPVPGRRGQRRNPGAEGGGRRQPASVRGRLQPGKSLCRRRCPGRRRALPRPRRPAQSPLRVGPDRPGRNQDRPAAAPAGDRLLRVRP